jgi:mono/diheme cytochrome c family protein
VIWFAAVLVLAAPRRTPQLIERGRNAYAIWCVACHGVTGAGDGPNANKLEPRPRNFAAGKFKQGSRVEQIYRTLSKGVPASAMVAYKNLSDEDRWALSYYVLELKAGRK